MLKSLVVVLLILAVSVVRADWSQNMSFSLNGLNFFCYLVQNGYYDCNHDQKTPPAPKFQPAPRPVETKPADPTPAPKPVEAKPAETKPADPQPAAAAQVKPAPTPTTPTTPAPSTPPSGDLNSKADLNGEQWNSNIVGAHNSFRGSMQDTPPLKWDGSLAGGCKSYAQQLAQSSCTLQHSGGDYGENLFQGWGDGCKKALDVIGYMFSECSQYQWGNPAFSEATGHFSQIVWKDTTGVAAGAASGSGGCCIVVLRYSPAGNVQGQFADNVAGYKGGDSGACKDKSAYSKKF